MHELSLAMSVLKIVEQEASKRDYTSIKSIELVIGTLSGVEFQAFEFSMNSVIKSSQFNDTIIIFTRINAQSICSECNHEFSPISRFEECPKCHSHLTVLQQGDEFRVSAITFVTA